MRLLAILLLCLLPLGSAWAQDIHRCVGKDGNPVFTDRVCTDVDATPFVPAPTSSVQQAPSESLAPPAILCAMDRKLLKQAVVEAFANRDPNRMAGLMLWGGDGRQAVVADIRAMGHLMERPLVDVTFGSQSTSSTDSASDLSAAPSVAASVTPSPSASSDILTVHTAADDGSGVPQATRFQIVHRSGCLWLEQGG
jgi:hypothetical protein